MWADFLPTAVVTQSKSNYETATEAKQHQKKGEACKQENHRRDRDHEQTDNTEKDNCWPVL